MTTPDAPLPQRFQADAPRPRRIQRLLPGWLYPLTPEILVALAFLVVQMNGVLHLGYAGQDFYVHMRWMEEAAAHPWHFLTQNQSQVMGRTNPPLYHLLAAAAALWGPFSAKRNIGILNLLAGLSGLLLFMATARIWIARAAIRFALYLLLAFLPVFCIQTLVMAADVLTMTAGGLILLGLSKVMVARGRDARLGTVLTAGGVGLGVMSKFTFMAAPGMVLLLALFLFRRQRLPQRRVFGLLLFGVGAPMLLGAGIWSRFHSTADDHFQRPAAWLKSSFSLSDLLCLKPKDRDLLNALPYARRLDLRTLTEEQAPYPEVTTNHDVHHPFALLQQHRYSYQALLVNALFTDLMNVRQPGRTGPHFGPRSLSNQTKMDVAIRSGWILYFSALLLTAWALWGSLRSAWVTGDTRSIFVLTTLGLASLLGVPVVSGLLFVFDGYLGGYWLPRLILFPLAATLLAVFIWLDHLSRRFSRRLAWPLVVIALWQSLLSLSFLIA